MVSNISPASLFRFNKDGSKTLLLDEAENLGKRGASNDMTFEILNSGYKKGGVVSRVYKDDIIEYTTYGPKIIAGINELAPATEDRCIIIETDSESIGKKVKPYLDTPEQRKELEPLKLNLFYQSPTLLQDILLDLSSNNNFCEDIRNRNRERWLPLLLIVKLLSGKMEKIMTAAKRDIDQKCEIEKSYPESIAISTMVGYISNQEDNCISKSSEYICFEASTISTVIKEADVYRKFTNQGQITKFLKTRDVLVDRVRVKGTPTTIYKIPINLLNNN
jgi:hypothetical protein